MALATKWEIGSVIALLVAVAGGALWIGELKGDVNALEKRVSALESDKKVALAVPRIGKGDLCLKLLEEGGRTKDAKRQGELEAHFREAQCDQALPAMMVKANKDQSASGWSNAVDTSAPPPPKPAPEK